MRKILSLLLTSTLVLSLCACSNTDNTPVKNDVNQESSDTTITENTEIEKEEISEPENNLEVEKEQEENNSLLDAEKEKVEDGEESKENVDIPEIEIVSVQYGALTLNIPKNIMDLITIEDGVSPEESHVWKVFDIYETKSIEAGQKVHPGENWGDGWLFGISVTDQIGFEEMAGWDPTGFSIIAKSDDKYYIYNHPTDVRVMREDNDYQSGMEEWSMLCEWANNMKDIIIKDNNLEPISVMNSDYTYDSEHKYFEYKDEWTHNVIVLSQPVQQGPNGIWCVERIEEYYNDEIFNTRLIFPIAMGIEKTAHQYYVELQEQVDNGQNLEALSAEKVLEEFLNSDAWYHGENNLDDFVEINR